MLMACSENVLTVDLCKSNHDKRLLNNNKKTNQTKLPPT
ncbi:hypothetical protein P3TCK_00585 [Photobacterium profundum 3TCK]|uniref:Uncharacterized protein n=1 Tax=Photobacterium profundum 3TCK TaxID=314280 RepID=Q1Z1H4_9GAMM|nr:hypothetical protein P3TCK_00585 [Photobacterium profundum 3TCK]